MEWDYSVLCDWVLRFIQIFASLFFVRSILKFFFSFLFPMLKTITRKLKYSSPLNLFFLSLYGGVAGHFYLFFFFLEMPITSLLKSLEGSSWVDFFCVYLATCKFL